jgi:hypothetical protein
LLRAELLPTLPAELLPAAELRLRAELRLCVELRL